MWHLTNRPAVADDPFELVARHADVGQHPVVKFLQRVDVPLQTLPGDCLLCEISRKLVRNRGRRPQWRYQHPADRLA